MHHRPSARSARARPPLPTPADLLAHLNVHLAGDGPTTLLFIHGFGCNQSMWRHILPAFTRDCRVVVLDLAAPRAWDPRRRHSLEAQALDVLSVAAAVDDGSDLVLVGHSVGATVALLASRLAPEGFAAQVLVAPSSGPADHLRDSLADSTLVIQDAAGLASDFTRPQPCASAMRTWLAGLGLVSLPGLPLPRPRRGRQREA